MRITLLALTLIFSLSTLKVNSQSIVDKEKRFPKEIEAKWYNQFVEKLNLEPQDCYEFGRFFTNGTLVSENDKMRIYVNGIAILNNRSMGNSNLSDFEVYYYAVFEVMTDYEVYFEKVEFWDIDQNGKLLNSKKLKAKEGFYFYQYYQSDSDYRYTGELPYDSMYLDMLDTYGIE